MNVNKKTLSVAIACLLGTASINANAAIIDLEISGTTTVTAGALSDAASDSSATSMSTFSNVGDDFGNFSSARARGDDTGWFYSTASSNNNATAESSVTQTYNVTNDSADDQFFDFSFEVMNGGISAYCGSSNIFEEVEFIDDGYGYGSACEGSNFASASYMAEILFNGSSIWNSTASIFDDVNGSTVNSSGAVLNNTSSNSNSINWGTTSFNIDLGLITANDAFTLEYVITTTGASAGDEFNFFSEELEFGGSYAYSQFGDPNGFGQGVGNIFTTTAATNTSVPVPATLGLLGLGLAGFRFSRKNK